MILSFDTRLSSLTTKDNTRRILLLFREDFKVLSLENTVFVHHLQIVKAILSQLPHFPYSSQKLCERVDESFPHLSFIKKFFEEKNC